MRTRAIFVLAIGVILLDYAPISFATTSFQSLGDLAGGGFFSCNGEDFLVKCWELLNGRRKVN